METIWGEPLVQTMFGLVMLLLGGFLGDLRRSWSAQAIAKSLQAHADMPAHRESEIKHEQHEKDLRDMRNYMDEHFGRLERKIDALREARGGTPRRGA